MKTYSTASNLTNSNSVSTHTWDMQNTVCQRVVSLFTVSGQTVKEIWNASENVSVTEIFFFNSHENANNGRLSKHTSLTQEINFPVPKLSRFHITNV
jgi:hypothetical protein